MKRVEFLKVLIGEDFGHEELANRHQRHDEQRERYPCDPGPCNPVGPVTRKGSGYERARET